MSQVRGCKYISFWKKRLSPAVGHAQYHLAFIFQADFIIDFYYKFPVASVAF